VAMMTKAGNIINQLKETLPHVKDLMHQLKTPVTKHQRGVIEDQLRHEFETALMDNVPSGMMIPLASMLARSTVVDITTIGQSIVVYFLCNSDKAQTELLHMMTSGSMQKVLDDTMELHTCTPITVDVCVASLQHKGWLFDIQLLYCF